MKLRDDIDEIPKIIDRFNAYAAEHQVPDAIRRTFDIALDDLLCNVISYAYETPGAHEIEVDFCLTEACLTVSISDNGEPFDPFAQTAPDTDLDLEDRDIGGLGIHLVRMMMDETGYRRDGGKNIVFAIKEMPPAVDVEP